MNAVDKLFYYKPGNYTPDLSDGVLLTDDYAPVENLVARQFLL
jgi:hypothetical protein